MAEVCRIAALGAVNKAFHRLMNWVVSLTAMRSMNGFERWHYSGRPHKCIECGKRLQWRLGRRKDGKLYRILACMIGEGSDGESGHEQFEWTSDQEFGANPFELGA